MSDFISLDDRIRATVESYFDIELREDDLLLSEIETLHIAGGEWLMQQGEEGDALYLMVQGRLQVLISNPSAPDSRPSFVGEVVPGDSVGEVSLLTGEPRAASIQAIRDSVVVKIGRNSFDHLAQEHPALVMKLAGNVARVLHESASGKQKSGRRMENIALLPLDSSDRISAFCDDLEAELAQHGSVLRLDSRSLGEHGAPIPQLGDDEDIPDSLRSWLNDQESRSDYLVFQCKPANTKWSRLARRQSDLLVFIADAKSDASIRRWEQAADDACSQTAARRVLLLLQGPESQEISGTLNWLEPRKLDYHLHVRKDCAADVSRVARMMTGRAQGLVLAAGAARGFAHIGVYGALQEAGIPIDWIGGTSIGAIMGAPMAAGWDYQKCRKIAKESFVGGKPFSDFTIPLMSLARGRRMEKLLKQHLDMCIEDLPLPFFCVSCSLDTGAPNIHEKGYLPDALRASAAMTGIIPPAVVDSRLAIDGSVINSMPVDIMMKKPVGKIIAVNISANKEYRVDYEKLPSPWAVLRGRYLPFSKKYRVAGLSTIMLKATELGTLSRVSQMSQQADLLLTPPVRKFGMTEIKAFDQIVDTGYEYARERLDDWLKQNRATAGEN